MNEVDENADLTAETNQEDEIVNDLDTLESEDGSTEGEDESTEEGKPEEKDKIIEKLEKQLRTSGKKYEKVTRDINKLRDIQQKPKETATLTEEEKKNKQADDYIDKRVEKKLTEKEKIRQEKEDEEVQALKDDLDDVLLENEDLTEDKILDVIEDFAKKKVRLTPIQAADFIKDGYSKAKPAAKPKPKLPASSRGSGKVDLSVKTEEKTGKQNYHEKFASIVRNAKKNISGQ